MQPECSGESRGRGRAFIPQPDSRRRTDAEQERERREREAVREAQGEGHVEGAGGEDRQLPGRLEPRRQGDGEHVMTAVNDIMTREPRTVREATSVVEAARVMRDEDVGSVPVVEGDRLVGMVTDRDIALRVVAEGRGLDTTVADVASRAVVAIDPQQEVEEAMRLMAEHQLRRLPVCEEDGRLVGVVAQADVARYAPEQTGRVVEDISEN